MVHAEKSIGPTFATNDRAEREVALDHLAVNCRFARMLGARLVVLHLWGLPDGDARIERNLAMLPACYDVAADHGVDLAIETIPCDDADPLTHVHRAIEMEHRCLVALDTEFLAYHRQLAEALAAEWLWTGSRVRHVHVKDYDGIMWTPQEGRRYLHPGDGCIDFHSFFAALRTRGFEGAISLEASSLDRDGYVNTIQLQQSIALIRQMIS